MVRYLSSISNDITTKSSDTNKEMITSASEFNVSSLWAWPKPSNMMCYGSNKRNILILNVLDITDMQIETKWKTRKETISMSRLQPKISPAEGSKWIEKESVSSKLIVIRPNLRCSAQPNQVAPGEHLDNVTCQKYLLLLITFSFSILVLLGVFNFHNMIDVKKIEAQDTTLDLSLTRKQNNH